MRFERVEELHKVHPEWLPARPRVDMMTPEERDMFMRELASKLTEEDQGRGGESETPLQDLFLAAQKMPGACTGTGKVAVFRNGIKVCPDCGQALEEGK